jgi:hypothetical protein
VLAAVFRCVGDVLTIAASLSSRSPFITPIEKREQADKVASPRTAIVGRAGGRR